MTIRGILKLFTDPLSVPEMPRVSPAVWQSGSDIWCALLCANDFRVKNDSSPQCATAPPGAGRDKPRGRSQGCGWRLFYYFFFLASGLENWPFCKGRTITDLPGRGEGGGMLLSLRQGRDVGGDEAHPLWNIRPKSIRQFGCSSLIASYRKMTWTLLFSPHLSSYPWARAQSFHDV